jgi:hypothetical protein
MADVIRHQSVDLRHMIMVAETTPGVWVEPATAQHIIRFRDIKFSTDADPDDENAKWGNGNHTEDQSVMGLQHGNISASVRCTVGATDVTAPQWWTPAYSCGCLASAAYSSTKGIGLRRRLAQDDATYSIAIYDTQIGGSAPLTTIYKYAGCIGNMVLGCEKLGAPWVAKFNWMGKLTDVIDGTDIALSSPGTGVGQSFTSAAFTINSTAEKVNGWQYDLGNVIKPVGDQSDATGISHYVITESHPRFTCAPLTVKQATTDWWANLLSKPSVNDIITNAPAAGKLSLTIIDAQALKMAPEVRDGLAAYGMTFKPLSNGVPGTLIDSGTGMTYEDTMEILQGTRS